jgi:hypothetical protein
MIGTSGEQNYTRNDEVACLLACYYEVLKQSLLLASLQCSIFLKRSSGTPVLHVLFDTEDVMQMTRLQFKRKCLLLKLSSVCHFVFYVNF